MSSLLFHSHYYGEDDEDFYSRHLASVDEAKKLVGPQPYIRYARKPGKPDLEPIPIGGSYMRIPHLGNRLYRV